VTTFTYQARDEAGRLIRGVLEAESKVVLADRLRKMGYLVTRMEEGTSALRGIRNIRLGPPVSREEFLLVCVELANLVEAGIPLISAVNSVAEQFRPGPLKEALTAVAKEVESGKSFSQALGHYPQIFPKLMASRVSVGEVSGQLDVVLQRFAVFYEKDLTLRKTVQAALTYPIFLMVMCLLLVLFVVSFVVPQFEVFFLRAGLSLPAPTRIVAGIGNLIRSHGWGLAFLVLAGIAGAGWVLRRPPVRRHVDEWLLRVPVVGRMVEQVLVARLARCLATMIGSGIPILSALETAAGVAGNDAVSRELMRARAAVERGEKISVALSVGRVFRPDVIQMLKAGEDSGRLDIMLDKTADFYDLRVGFTLKQMTTLIEPVLLVCMGVVVAFIMASLLLPMFDLVKVMQRGGIR
jgi:type IV pilus assembly protein PilC